MRIFNVKFGLLIIAICYNLNAQVPSSVDYGIYCNYNRNYHTTDFQGSDTLFSIFSQGKAFKNGDGTGISAGFIYNIPLPYSLYTGFRLGYSSYNGNMSVVENTNFLIGADTVIGSFKHTLDARIADIGIEPYLGYTFYKYINLFVGGRIGYTLQKQYTQKMIPDNPNAIFLDTMLNKGKNLSGNIPDSRDALSSLFLGISLNIPLTKSKSFVLQPEFIYSINTSIIPNTSNWNINVLKIGVALKFAPDAGEYPVDNIQKVFKYDTVIVFSDQIGQSKYVYGRAEKYQKIDSSSGDITINEYISRTDTIIKPVRIKARIQAESDVIKFRANSISEILPILPVVFFDNKSSDISQFYFRFDEVRQIKNSLELHKNILNVIGKRLKDNPESSILLRGYADSTSESSDCILSANRAQSVKKYLISNFHIDDSRINIAEHSDLCSPLQPTETKNDSGYAENRRVEIITLSKEILSAYKLKIPESAKDSLLLQYEPSELYFNPLGSRMTGGSSWKLEAKQGDNLIFEQEGNSVYESGVPAIPSIKLNKEIASKLIPDIPLKVRLTITDENGSKIFADTKIDVKMILGNTILNRLSLILFDVNSSELSATAQKELEEFAKSFSQSKIIKVTGYTDILGNSEKNKQLSQKRADNVASILKKLLSSSTIESIGMGADSYPNGIESYKTPAERFLCRIVMIEIQ